MAENIPKNTVFPKIVSSEEFLGMGDEHRIRAMVDAGIFIRRYKAVKYGSKPVIAKIHFQVNTVKLAYFRGFIVGYLHGFRDGVLSRNDENTSSAPPAMDLIVQFSNWFPAPSTRKKLKKLIGDQETHISELHRAKQYRAARWNWYCTWLLMFWYGLKDFVLGIAKTVRGKSSA